MSPSQGDASRARGPAVLPPPQIAWSLRAPLAGKHPGEPSGTRARPTGLYAWLRSPHLKRPTCRSPPCLHRSEFRPSPASPCPTPRSSHRTVAGISPSKSLITTGPSAPDAGEFSICYVACCQVELPLRGKIIEAPVLSSNRGRMSLPEDAANGRLQSLMNLSRSRQYDETVAVVCVVVGSMDVFVRDPIRAGA
jgi:hypothetical protein